MNLFAKTHVSEWNIYSNPAFVRAVTYRTSVAFSSFQTYILVVKSGKLKCSFPNTALMFETKKHQQRPETFLLLVSPRRWLRKAAFCSQSPGEAVFLESSPPLLASHLILFEKFFTYSENVCSCCLERCHFEHMKMQKSLSKILQKVCFETPGLHL